MSEISAVSGSSNIYGHIASGQRIQSAADGAAELAIGQEMNKEATGLEVGASNMEAGVDLSNIADSALSGIQDYLQRMRELALQASNGFLSNSDKASIQKEIDGIKQGINDIASNTDYNGLSLLDGSNSNIQIAGNPDGSGTSISINSTLLSDLGLANFDVTGSFDISKIDDAMDLVSNTRGNIGAKTNALEYGINYNYQAAENTTAAQSRLEDLDIPTAVSEQKKQELLNNYQLTMQQRVQQNQEEGVRRLFN